MTACGRDCPDSYPAGTRLTVTVQNAFDACHVTFDEGQMYDLVAGPPHEVEVGDGDACEMNFPTDFPAFKTSEFEWRACGSGKSAMDLECPVVLSTCVDPSGAPSGNLEAQYGALPTKKGEAVATELRTSFIAHQSCVAHGCSARIPVVVRW